MTHVPEYPFEEFMIHFDELSRLLYSQEEQEEGVPSLTRTLVRSLEYMKTKYEDIEEARFKAARFNQAMHFLASNLEYFGVIGGPAVVSSGPERASLVDESLLKAVHQVAIEKPRVPDLSPEVVLKLARSFQEE